MTGDEYLEYGTWQKINISLPATYGTVAAPLISMGLRLASAAVAGNIWIDGITYTSPIDDYPLFGPDEYNENLLALKARAILNFNTQRVLAEGLAAKVDKAILDYAMSDGSGERPRRLIVRVP